MFKATEILNVPMLQKPPLHLWNVSSCKHMCPKSLCLFQIDNMENNVKTRSQEQAPSIRSAST